ncbi:T9SS C-terminal target domain-containing protein, partial [archaeon]|nr:T9SS C-terminal target domain-containing protein [archaeon]
ETIGFSIPFDANLGDHILRAKSNWSSEVPNDPCSETTYGETEDYSVVIVESSLGIIENTFSENPIIFPNPTNGNVSIDLRINYNNVIIQLNDILGRKIIEQSYNQGRVFNLNIKESSGIYFLNIVTENKRVVFRLVKN